MDESRHGSDDESEEFNSSTSSLDLKKSNAPIIPRIQSVKDHRAFDAQESKEINPILDAQILEFAPILDKIDLGSNTSLGFDFQRPENNDPTTISSHNLSSMKLDDLLKSENSDSDFKHQTQSVGQSSPQESEEFQSSSSSINIGNTSKFIELTPRVKTDAVGDLDLFNLALNLNDEAVSRQESEEFSSNNSSLDIIPNAITQSHAPRITSVLETGNIAKELKEILNLNSETSQVFEKVYLTTVPSQNMDSPQESDELNSSSSSIGQYNLNSTPLVPRTVQVEPLNENVTKDKVSEVADQGEEMIRIRSFENLKSENSSPAESEEFKSSNSSIDLVLSKDKTVFINRKSMDLTSQNENALKANENPNAVANENNPNIALKSTAPQNGFPEKAIMDKKVQFSTDSTGPDNQGSESKSKFTDKAKKLRPRNSAAIDPPTRLSMLGSPSESSSVESTSEEDEPEQPLSLADEREQPAIKNDFHGKYHRFFVPRSATKPKLSSPTDDVGYYFVLYDQKCYFSGFLFKRNELGANGNLLNKTHTIRQYGTVERGGEWVKYWAEIIGGLLLLWRVPAELQAHIYPKKTNPTDHEKHPKNPSEKGIASLIQAELFPSLECIESIKLKSTPFILQLINSSTELKTSSFSSLYAEDILPPPLPFTSIFTVSNQGRNRYKFAAPAFITSNLWVRAIQLSIFENDQINFIFSMKLLKEPRYLNVWTDLSIPPFSLGIKGHSKPFECLVDAQHGLEMQSKRYYCIVSHEKLSGHTKNENKASNRKSTLFGHVQTDAVADAARDSESVTEEFKGMILLYDDEADHDRRHSPSVKIEDVHSAFLIWPRSKISSENEFVTSIKLYGNISYIPTAEVKKKKDRKSRLTWNEVEKSNEKSKENPVPAISQDGCSFLTLSFENTQLSLRFLVSIWNSFGIETIIESCYEKEHLWNNPPVGWGNLSLKVDELFGDFDLSNIRNSYDSFDRMLHDKLMILKIGLPEEWITGLNSLGEFHDNAEKEEVLIKADTLIQSAMDLPKDSIIPVWLDEEMNSRNINHKDRKSGAEVIESENRPDINNGQSDIRIPPSRDNSLLINFAFDKSNFQLLEAGTQIKSVEKKQKNDGKLKHISYLTSNDSQLALEREFSSSSSSANTSSSEELPKESDKPCMSDLTITIPNGLNIDTHGLISSWTEEEHMRFQSYVAWITKECGNHNINGGIDNLDPDKLIFESKSLLGTGLNQRPKKEAIHGPLIYAIPKNNNSSVLDDMKNTPLNEGLLGNHSRSSEGIFGIGRNRSSTLLSVDKNDPTHSLTPIRKGPEEIIFQEGLLAQKKQPINHTAGYGPLISAIPKTKAEVQPVNDLDHGLIGQMRSRESFIQKSKTPPKPKNVNQRQSSYMNPGSSDPTMTPKNQSFYGYPAPYYFGPYSPYSSPIDASTLATIPTPESAESSHSYFNTNPQYFNQAVNAQSGMYQTPLSFLPMDYQQALFYQQYMYSLESQKKPKNKKKNKKKKGKKKKKESLLITNSKLEPVNSPFSMQNHLFYNNQEQMNPSPAEPFVRPIIESSSEESVGSDQEKLWSISQRNLNHPSRGSIESEDNFYSLGNTIQVNYSVTGTDGNQTSLNAVESSSEESVES